MYLFAKNAIGNLAQISETTRRHYALFVFNNFTVTNCKKVKMEIDKSKTTVCPYCKQEYKTKVGLSNWKNLFRKPTLDDWMVLIILIFLMFSAYAYILDTKTCKETLNNLDIICSYYNSAISLNITNITMEIYNQTFFMNISNHVP